MPRVPTRLKVARGRAIVLASAALLAGGVGVGCDSQENADLERGRQLFIDNCGTCHTLAEAGTGAPVGPDLDASFAAARDVGMDQDTIEGVVQSQIENPREIREDNPYHGQTFMPANLVTGQDAEDVAAYVASVAGIPGIEPPPLPEDDALLFGELCGSCHTLAEAGTVGTVGPNLDDALPGQPAAAIEESIRNPEAQMSAFPFPGGGVMPPFDEVRLPEADLQRLVDYLMSAAGSGGGGG
jgi:mono/diheme cytochrome c family protein